MRIKHSPCQRDGYDTQIEYVDENTINIDGEDYSFDPQHVSWPNVSQDTNGFIIEAHRESGELFVTVRRFYKSGHEAWDTGAYGAFNG